jgi:RNA polymerase sigma-70 factor, ECF subfamily
MNEERAGMRDAVAPEPAEVRPTDAAGAGGPLKSGGSGGEPVLAPAEPDVQARFEKLIAEHLDGLYRSAVRLTRNATAAEDLVQEVMLKAWRSFHTFQEGTSIRAWLHRILMNAFFDSYRKHAREPEVIDQPEVGEFYLYDKVRDGDSLGGAGNPEVEVLDRILDADVRDSLESLPVQYRAAVLLSDVQGFTYKEIAEMLGIPVGTVMSRLFRGRHLLQRQLWESARKRHLLKGDGR